MAVAWSVEPDQLMVQVVDKHRKKCEEIALQVFAGVVERTPVISGDLRASWKIGIEGVDGTIETGGSPQNPLAAPTVPTSLEGLSDFPVINVTNSQPYAEQVENGGPKNRPRHMVQLTLESLKK